MRYLITFACYGGHLHGDERGSVDRHHSLAGSRLLAPDPERVAAECRSMLQKPYVLDQTAREVVLAALRQHCTWGGWNLLAAHVWSNHVHAIVEAEIQFWVSSKRMPAASSNVLEAMGRIENGGRGTAARAGFERTKM